MADRARAERIVRAYYDAFNARDVPGFLALLSEDVVHHISQGGRETGRQAFARFLAHMNRCYDERITDLVVMTDESGAHAAAEFLVRGKYLQTDPSVPAGTRPASGQTYVLPAGAFFTLRDGQVARITNHYNLADWIAQVNRA
ncbi:MAG: nuclear transport factor 2 family protein [Acetobacteraceae bacterium]|nr:nuclear transport factor 2 family protein [Acetobacteraceae bacterium]